MASRHSTCWQPDKKPIFSLSKTGSFMLPQPISKLVKEGMELGDADDKISGRVKSKHGSGTVGYLTEGMIDRSAYYEHALILALVPWIRPDMYNSKGLSTNSALTVEGSDDTKSGEQ
jgi:non-canonical (house-cleaning) NTP pyrophosphatase